MKPNIKLEVTPVGEYCTEGCALVAGAVARARALPAPHALATSHGPSGYRNVAKHLQDRVKSILKTLAQVTADDPFALEQANDLILQRLETNLAQLEGRPLPPEQPPIVIAQQLQYQHSHKNVPRPQILFKDPVDNDPRNLWVPKIKSKPNAIAPLKLIHEYNDDGKPVGYVHPYSAEIEAYNPPAEFLQPELLPKIVLKDKSKTPLTLVQTKDELNSLIAHLKTVKEMAIDLEHHSYRTFQGITCLIQISTEEGGDFIIDALALREYLQALNESFTDPSILKVFHGADSDVVWLQQDFGVYIVGLFDTHRAAVQLGLPTRSLQYLMAKYCKEHVDKRLQLADWRARPLTDDLLDYARSDTHNLLYIWRCMLQELLAAKDDDNEPLLAVFKSSQRVALRTYRKPLFNENAYLDFSQKCRKKFNSRQLAALKSLFKWRDSIAREEDESMGYVLPNHMLLEISISLPRETSGILACCKPTPPLLLQNINQVYKLISEARDQPLIEPIIEEPTPEIKQCSFSLTSFDRQILDDGFKKLSLGDTIDTQDNHPKTSMFASCKNVDTNAMKFCIPPFERYILIQKYNEVNPPVQPVVTNIQPAGAKHSLANESPEKLDTTHGTITGKIPFDAPIEPPRKKSKPNEGDPEFIHKYRKPFKGAKDDNNEDRNSSRSEPSERNKQSFKGKKKRWESQIPELMDKHETSNKRKRDNVKTEEKDESFETFDYKNYDYNVYNKDPNLKKKKMNKKRK